MLENANDRVSWVSQGLKLHNLGTTNRKALLCLPLGCALLTLQNDHSNTFPDVLLSSPLPLFPWDLHFCSSSAIINVVARFYNKSRRRKTLLFPQDQRGERHTQRDCPGWALYCMLIVHLIDAPWIFVSIVPDKSVKGTHSQEPHSESECSLQSLPGNPLQFPLVQGPPVGYSPPGFLSRSSHLWDREGEREYVSFC